MEDSQTHYANPVIISHPPPHPQPGHIEVASTQGEEKEGWREKMPFVTYPVVCGTGGPGKCALSVNARTMLRCEKHSRRSAALFGHGSSSPWGRGD